MSDPRCSLCNGELTRVDKADVICKVPERVAQRNDEFFICKDCRQIYWKGTHWENMKRTIASISERIDEENRSASKDDSSPR